VTHYELDGVGIEPCGVNFSTSTQTRPKAHPTYPTIGTRSFPGVKWLGCCADHWTPSSTGVKRRNHTSTPALLAWHWMGGRCFMFVSVSIQLQLAKQNFVFSTVLSPATVHCRICSPLLAWCIRCMGVLYDELCDYLALGIHPL